MYSSRLSRRRLLSGAALAAGAAGLTSAAGCGGNSSGDSDPGTIRVLAWSNGPSIDANFKRRVVEFNKAKGGEVKATLQLLPYDQYWQKIQLAYSARQPYDIYYWDVQAYTHYKSELVKNLQPEIDQTDLVDAAKYPAHLYEPWKFDGSNMYACPENIQTMVMFYNKDVFDEAGLSYPDDTWSWDDVIGEADKLTVRTGDKVSQWGLYTGALNIWWGLQTLSWAQDTAFVDKELEPTKLQMSDPLNIETMKFVYDLIYTHKVAPTPTQTSGLAQDIGVFETGKVAMLADGAWNIAAYKEVDFNWGIAPLPTFAGKRVAPYWLGGWMIPVAGKSQEAAFGFAEWSATDFQPQMAKDHDWIPLRTADRESETMLAQLDEARIGDIYHSNNLQIVEEVFNPAFEQLWMDKMSPEDAAKQMDDKGNGLLGA